MGNSASSATTVRHAPDLRLKLAYYEQPHRHMCSLSVVFFLHRGHADYEFILQLMKTNGETCLPFDQTVRSRIDTMAGKITHCTRERSVVLTLTVPSVSCKEAFALLMGMVFNTACMQSQETLDTEKMVYTERQGHSTKNRSRLLQFGACTPWLNGATIEHTHLVWRHLVSFVDMGIVVCGKWEGELQSAFATACQYRSDCRRDHAMLSECSIEVVPTIDPATLYAMDAIDVRDGDATCSVCINFHLPDVVHGTNAFYALHILSSIVGESRTSKIRKRIEDCRSFAKSAETTVVYSHEQGCAHFVVTAVMDSSVYAKTAASLESSIQSVHKSITAEDVRTHVQRKVHWLIASMEDMHRQSCFDCEMFIDDHQDSTLAIANKIKRINLKDVVQVSKRLSDAARCTFVLSH